MIAVSPKVDACRVLDFSSRADGVQAARWACLATGQDSKRAALYRTVHITSMHDKLFLMTCDGRRVHAVSIDVPAECKDTTYEICCATRRRVFLKHVPHITYPNVNAIVPELQEPSKGIVFPGARARSGNIHVLKVFKHITKAHGCMVDYDYLAAACQLAKSQGKTLWVSQHSSDSPILLHNGKTWADITSFAVVMPYRT